MVGYSDAIRAEVAKHGIRVTTAGDEAWAGSESRPPQLPRLVTALSDRAAVRNNELLATR